MEKYLISLLLACVVFTGCSNSDLDIIPEQDVLLSGFRMDENGNMEAEDFRFLFFADDFSCITSTNPQNCQSYKEYIQLEEETVYANLMANEYYVSVSDGVKKEPLFVFVNNRNVNWGQTFVKLPIGHYTVFAFRHKIDDDKRIWNKYGCSRVVISENSEPQIVKCILPVDYTFVGRSWRTDHSLRGDD